MSCWKWRVYWDYFGLNCLSSEKEKLSVKEIQFLLVFMFVAKPTCMVLFLMYPRLQFMHIIGYNAVMNYSYTTKNLGMYVWCLVFVNYGVRRRLKKLYDDSNLCLWSSSIRLSSWLSLQVCHISGRLQSCFWITTSYQHKSQVPNMWLFVEFKSEASFFLLLSVYWMKVQAILKGYRIWGFWCFCPALSEVWDPFSFFSQGALFKLFF